MAQKIDIKTVDEIAHLARLEFNDEAKGENLKRHEPYACIS
jgi:Asp-tRNA(Asn)/Glu-tRNA(Gln) amidotransferase C subunit